MSGRWKRYAVMLFALALNFSAAAAEAVVKKKWDVEGYWLPEAASSYAEKIDGLFNGILYLTGFVFVVTELLLLFFLIKYRHKEGRRALYTHGNHKLEMIWTLVPALILAIIAFVQKSTWDDIKTRIPDGADTVQIKSYAEQFQWNFRYAGSDGKWATEDDIFEKNIMTVPVNKEIVIEQTSKDVIHSFFLPYMRLKQDVVPGMQIKVWFKPTKTTKAMQASRPPAKVSVPQPDGTMKEDTVTWNYEIVCAELCGNQHSQMRGELRVLDSDDYDKWLKKRSKEYADGDWEVNEKLWNNWKIDEKGNRIIPVAAKKEEKKTEEKH
jgi:cytochrome c oxidase subunit II